MLYRTTKKLIENYKKHNNKAGLTELATKIDIFFAAGKLTEAEYNELTAMLNF